MGARKCKHRSQKIGELKPNCWRGNVFECHKYSTLCTLTTPSEWNLPLLIDGVATETRVTREGSRVCSICRMNNEDG